MHISSNLFLIFIKIFLIILPLNAFAEDITFTCKPVVGGFTKKNGNLYLEDATQNTTPLLDAMPTSQFLIKGENVVFYKNNQNREFEILVPYKTLKDSEEMQNIEKSLSSMDEIFSLGNFKTFYLRYKGDDGHESLKRISINETNTKTADITIHHTNFPSNFSKFFIVFSHSNL